MLPPNVTWKPGDRAKICDFGVWSPCRDQSHTCLSGLCFCPEPGCHLGSSPCSGQCLYLWSCCSRALCCCLSHVISGDDRNCVMESEGHAEPSLYLACPGIAGPVSHWTLQENYPYTCTLGRWPHPSPLVKEDLPQLGHKGAGSTHPLPKGGSPSCLDWPAQLLLRHSWAWSWFTLTSTLFRTYWNSWRDWSCGAIPQDLHNLG